MQSNNSQELSAKSVANLEKLINEWIGKTRWFISDRANPQAHILHGYTLASDFTSSTTLLIVRSGSADYFLPITLSITDPELLSALSEYPEAVLGYLDINGQNLAVIDSTEHPKGQITLLQACLGELSVPQLSGSALRGQLSQLPAFKRIDKLRSEQSNTSIVYEFETSDEADSSGLIMKLFRIVHPGENPDVQLQAALDKFGSATVPKQYGSARVELGAAGSAPTADVLSVQEFLTGAKDAWQVFQQELASGVQTPQNPEAIFALGAVTADIHSVLAESFPTVPIHSDAKI
ncbi:hypothetical protein RQN30_04590 [Arcanobacterium hippocoleae]